MKRHLSRSTCPTTESLQLYANCLPKCSFLRVSGLVFMVALVHQIVDLILHAYGPPHYCTTLPVYALTCAFGQLPVHTRTFSGGGGFFYHHGLDINFLFRSPVENKAFVNSGQTAGWRARQPGARSRGQDGDVVQPQSDEPTQRVDLSRFSCKFPKVQLGILRSMTHGTRWYLRNRVETLTWRSPSKVRRNIHLLGWDVSETPYCH